MDNFYPAADKETIWHECLLFTFPKLKSEYDSDLTLTQESRQDFSH